MLYIIQKENNKYTEPIYEEEDIKPQELTANILLISALSGLIGAKFFTNLKIGMILYLTQLDNYFLVVDLLFMGV